MTLAHRIAERIRAADEHNRPSPDPEMVDRVWSYSRSHASHGANLRCRRRSGFDRG